MTIRRIRILVGALLPLQLVLSTGCVDWYHMQTTTPPEPAPRSMQVWTGDSAVVVRYPVARNDSLIATIGGDSARQGGVPAAWPLAEVDSTRLRHFSPTRTLFAGFGVISVLAMLLAVGGGISYE